MLLTSGQISMGISSGIVFIFTSLLFLSGYVLQQQTVRSLQAAIRPIPQPSLAPSPSATSSAAEFGDSSGSSRGHVAYQQYLERITPKGGWSSVGYAQMVRDHLMVCNTVMAFAELARNGSPAKRLILYPSKWNEDVAQGKKSGRQVQTSMRLLRMAAKQYEVTLVPIEPVAVDLVEGEVFATVLNTSQSKFTPAGNLEGAYPLASLFSLTNFNRLVHLQPSGLIQDTSKLDRLFTLPMSGSIATFSSLPKDTTQLPSVLVFKPSIQSHNDLLDALSSKTYSETNYISQQLVSPDPTSIQKSLTLETSLLDIEDEDSGMALSSLNSVSYVHFSDPLIPGPEYDVPRDLLRRSKPRHMQARKLWEDVYEMYRQQRMAVCSLDLEPIDSAGGGTWR